MNKTVITIEFGEDGTFSCYNDAPIGDYGVIVGEGATVAEAKADFQAALKECADAYPADARYTGLEF